MFDFLKQQVPFSDILPVEFQFRAAIHFDLSSQQSPFYGVSDLQQLLDITRTIMQDKNVNLGIGDYAEERFIYQSHTQYSDRTIHLGLDLTVPVGTQVMTPLDATVHSVAYHSKAGDYGSTVILQHQYLGKIFYTLYGHLSRSCLRELAVGCKLAAGECFATVGRTDENGGWPPHLHLQIIHDLGGFTDDYPGVCSPAEKVFYLQNCPDPSVFFIHI